MSPTPDRTVIVLDTAVWIWAMDGDTDRLGPVARRRIEVAARDGRLVASAISVWEIAMLVRKRRLALAVPVAQWVRESERAPGLTVIPVSASLAIESVGLPDFDHHRDPADRLIAATARQEGVLLTTDRVLLEWAATHGHLRAEDAAC